MEAERVVEGRPHPGSRSARLRRAESAENFPVALRVLPSAVRGHLRAVYDVVRVIDNLGDDPGTPADRLAALEAFGADLATVWTTGRPRDPVLVALVGTVRAVGLDHRDLAALVAANMQDQRISRYRTYEQLRGYCALSAAPVGRLVLEVFGAADAGPGGAPTGSATALQLFEHWQDVGRGPPGRGGSTCRPRSWPVRGHRPTCRPATAPAVAPLSSDRPGCGRCWRPARAGRHAARLGACRGGRLCRRRAGRGRRAAPPARPARWPPTRSKADARGTLVAVLPGRAGDRSPAGAGRCRAATRTTVCARITRPRPRNFSCGIRLLPADKRDALSAVYALARRIDDIGDGELPRAEKLTQLAGCARAIAAPAGRRRPGAGRASPTPPRRLPDPARRVRRARRRRARWT